MKQYAVLCRTYAQKCGQLPILLHESKTFHAAKSSRSAVRLAGAPRGAEFRGQGVWTDKPAPGSIGVGAEITFSRWYVSRNRRAEPGWGKGPRGSFLEGFKE